MAHANRSHSPENFRSAFSVGFDHILSEAFRRGASDIHIEHTHTDLVVRIRIDGILHELTRVSDPEYRRRLSEQAKKLCEFDLGKSGVTQDSRFSHHELPVTFRGSLIPSLFGEKIVLRLLEQNKEFNLNKYPLPQDARSVLFDAIGKSSGLVIVSGPTGSGKSTLLYSALAAIDRFQKNVHTLEDPIEYTLPGLTQTQVSRNGSVTFADGLRALMRQDPDVIYLGEIRDEETAEAALHAAKTGHLVLTTIHANNAHEILARLEGLGCKPTDILSTINFASAQRLLPQNCPQCVEVDRESAHNFEFPVFHSRGCEACEKTGVKGRVLLFEYLDANEIKNNSEISAPSQLKSQAICYLKEGQINVQTAKGV